MVFVILLASQVPPGVPPGVRLAGPWFYSDSFIFRESSRNHLGIIWELWEIWLGCLGWLGWLGRSEYFDSLPKTNIKSTRRKKRRKP